MGKKSNTEEFIKKAKEIYGDKYDYSKVIYKGSRKKIILIYPIHGSFYQQPRVHSQGHKCPKFSGVHVYSTEEYINPTQ